MGTGVLGDRGLHEQSRADRDARDLATWVHAALEQTYADTYDGEDADVLVVQAIAREVAARLRAMGISISSDFVCWAADHDSDMTDGFRACASQQIIERYEAAGWLPLEAR